VRVRQQGPSTAVDVINDIFDDRHGAWHANLSPAPGMDIGMGEDKVNSEQAIPRIEILHVQDCPLVERVRETVDRILAQLDIPAEVAELVGDHPSPTLLVDGRDVTGRPLGGCAACRLDVPTEAQIMAALGRSPAGDGVAEPEGHA
jgi:hypothetical protein